MLTLSLWGTRQLRRSFNNWFAENFFLEVLFAYAFISTISSSLDMIKQCGIWYSHTDIWRVAMNQSHTRYYVTGLHDCVWIYTHDNVIKWRYFPRYWPFVRGNSPAPGEFPSQRPVTRSFDVFFDLRLNKRLSKQSWGWWFETPSRSLWRHRNVKLSFFPVNCAANGLFVSNSIMKRLQLRFQMYLHIYVQIGTPLIIPIQT